MTNFKIVGAFGGRGTIVRTTYLTPPSYDYKEKGLHISCDDSSLSPKIVHAIVFAVEQNVKSLTVDGVQLEREGF